jgi:hypothetical protein
MKHLVQVMAVFLLMGCQTNNNTPKDMISPKPVKSEVQSLEQSLVKINKPVICGDSNRVLTSLVTKSGEQPVMLWDDQTHGHKIVVMMNKKTKSITVLEWPQPNLACMISSGVNGSFNGKLDQRKQSNF